jgi:putative flippase GtrA
MDDVAHQARFAAVMTAITRRLPFGLSEVVAPSLVGYLLINLCTFFVDLGLLGLFHGHFGWPIPVAVTLSYGTASVLSYVLNRVLNFRSHDDVGKQFPVYVAVSVSNYLIFVLGLTDLLSAVGVYYELSRIIAACCEAVYLYTMLRFVVFRDSPAGANGVAGAEDPGAPGAAAAVARPAPAPAEKPAPAPDAPAALPRRAGRRRQPPSAPASSAASFRSRCTASATCWTVSIPYCSVGLSSVSTAIR